MTFLLYVLVVVVFGLLSIFAARYVASFLFLAALFLVLGDSVGDSLGLSNLFRDSLTLDGDAPKLRASATFWTAGMITFCSGLIAILPAFSWLFRPPQRDENGNLPALGDLVRRGTVRGLVFWVLSAAILTFQWWTADPTEGVVGELRRALIGGLLGVLACLVLSVLSLFSVFAFYVKRFFPRTETYDWVGGSITFVTHLYAWVGPISKVGQTIIHFLQKGFDLVAVNGQRQSEEEEETAGYEPAAVTLVSLFIGLGVGFVFWQFQVLPGIGILMILLIIFTAMRWIGALPPVFRIVLVVAVMGGFYGLSLFDRATFKHTFDGLNGPDGVEHYAPGQQLALSNPPPQDAECGVGLPAVQPLNTIDVMENWLARQRVLQGVERPKMVIIATSGGAYRASFWTTLVLDRLMMEGGEGSDIAGILDAVRFITGASGGMVGGAYLSALSSERPWPPSKWASLTRQLELDIEAAQVPDPDRPAEQARAYYTNTAPRARDSLSAMSQHLLQTDMPSLVRPGTEFVDRGKVLENHWGSINRSFRRLRSGEEKGWRPSILLSPMMVESGQPLLISNLDLSFLPAVRSQEMVELFSLFPCARSTFTVATAVRMSATFPYITPAVSLPTEPRRRVVDAGYYDNYGVALINALLSNDPETCGRRVAGARQGTPGGLCLRDWLRQNTSGVLVLEIRAFRLGVTSEPDGHCDEDTADDENAFRGLQFVTSPIEAVLSARNKTMVFRNEQALRQAESVQGDTFVRRVTFVNCAPGSLNWIVPDDEMEAMKADLEEQWPARLQELAHIWAQRGQ